MFGMFGGSNRRDPISIKWFWNVFTVLTFFKVFSVLLLFSQMTQGRCFLEKEKPLRASLSPYGGLLGAPGNFDRAQKQNMESVRFIWTVKGWELLVPHESEYSYGSFGLSRFVLWVQADLQTPKKWLPYFPISPIESPLLAEVDDSMWQSINSA